MSYEHVICDLGAIVSLMPLLVRKKLGISELKFTNISLQLMGQSIKYPIGTLEDVIIRIGKLFIPTHFIVMEMEEESQVLILLERLLFNTIRVTIDVKNGKLIFNVENKN